MLSALFLLLGWVTVTLLAMLLRNRTYATFAGVFLAIVGLVWAALLTAKPWPLQPVIIALQCIAMLHFVMLTRPSLRPHWYRAVVSIPGLWFMAGSLLAMPWALVAALGLPPYGWWLPWVLALFGVWQSLNNPTGEIDVVIDGRDAGALSRHEQRTGAGERALRIWQITDPHLGPFMSTERLSAICNDAVAAQPDLVLITGDLLTMESQMDVAAVTRALQPLRALQGRVFACLGNHDHEARATVEQALENIGGHLLVDAMAVANTAFGKVEIVGADFVYRQRKEHLRTLFDSLPDRGALPRILLLHDPGAFRHVPDGAVDLTLSGHTHGGHVGLLSLGLNWTAIGAASSIPDHGLWSQGRNRLYVHRGTGHYGFPIRLGVPGEEGVMRVWWSGSR